MDWREHFGERLVSAEEAVKEVQSHDVVLIGSTLQQPYVLCKALGKRANTLERVTIVGSSTILPMPWHEPGSESAFSVVTKFVSPRERPLLNEGRVDVLFLDTALGGKHYIERPTANRRILMARVSEPDQHGYCSFGEMIWFSKVFSRSADVILAEVCPGMIRTYGENYIHVSEIDRFVKVEPCHTEQASEMSKASGMVLSDPDEIRVAEVIGATIATDLIKDNDVIQIGAGAVSGAMCAYLHNHKDLGIHTELVTGGVVDLVREGVITGRTKTNHVGKVVGSAIMGETGEGLAYVDGNQAFELYDITYTNDPRVICQNDNAVSINNALAVDLSGQVSSDSLGPKVYTGPGGQLDFVLGSMLSRGGRSIMCLPSTAKGGKVSRIVPTLAVGQGVTTPRTLVDYIVTEYGIASLFGKSLKERVGELIAIAHPDFRAELTGDAKKFRWL